MTLLGGVDAAPRMYDSNPATAVSWEGNARGNSSGAGRRVGWDGSPSGVRAEAHTVRVQRLAPRAHRPADELLERRHIEHAVRRPRRRLGAQFLPLGGRRGRKIRLQAELIQDGGGEAEPAHF